ncbi:MAG: hypothetical protein LAT76_07200, partial [Schleiferiaceae bacterium]|nr:hypothetical protein [Schleiferiaceae bacterium]
EAKRELAYDSALSADEKLNFYFTLISAHFYNDDFESVEKAVGAARKEFENDPFIQDMIHLLLWQKGNMAKAKEYFMSLPEKWVNAHLHLAAIGKQEGDTNTLVYHLQKAHEVLLTDTYTLTASHHAQKIIIGFLNNDKALDAALSNAAETLVQLKGVAAEVRYYARNFGIESSLFKKVGNRLAVV